MKEKPLPDPEDFKVLREIASLVKTKTTSHALGQHLVTHGLRHRDGSPTNKARQDDWAISYSLYCGGVAYKWDSEKVLDLCSEFPPHEKGRRKA